MNAMLSDCLQTSGMKADGFGRCALVMNIVLKYCFFKQFVTYGNIGFYDIFVNIELFTYSFSLTCLHCDVFLSLRCWDFF